MNGSPDLPDETDVSPTWGSTEDSGGAAGYASPTLDLGPLSAYRLGRNSHDIRMWYEISWNTPGDDSAWDGVPYSIELLRLDRLTLARFMHPNIFSELADILDEVATLASSLRAAWDRGEGYLGWDFATHPAPPTTLWSRLEILADNAIDQRDPLRAFYDLGSTLGAYNLELWDFDPRRVAPDTNGSVPEIRRFLDATTRLPREFWDRIPQTGSLRGLSTLAVTGVEHFDLVRFVKAYPKDINLYLDLLGINVLVMGQVIDALDSSISGTLISWPAQPRGERRKPTWIPDLRQLFFDGKVIRTFKRQGSDILRVVQAFEEQDWPDRIGNPFGNDHVQSTTKIAEALDSLNTGLTGIRFHGDGSGSGILWAPWAKL